jgi:hypothetical protein
MKECYFKDCKNEGKDINTKPPPMLLCDKHSKELDELIRESEANGNNEDLMKFMFRTMRKSMDATQ